MKMSDPDKGPPMMEGAHKFDKGYESDEEYFSPRGVYPDDHERGNKYMMKQNEIVHRDSKKLNNGKFTKIA
jgi:hypothetical protein